jgi:hypothetical protein
MRGFDGKLLVCPVRTASGLRPLFLCLSVLPLSRAWGWRPIACYAATHSRCIDHGSVRPIDRSATPATVLCRGPGRSQNLSVGLSFVSLALGP